MTRPTFDECLRNAARVLAAAAIRIALEDAAAR